MTTYRFRMEVLDRPGALARVTDVLAAAGGNVESLDLHKPHKGVAIDEISVTAPDDWDMVAVCAAIDALDGIRVMEHHRDRPWGDPIVNALRWARVMVAAGSADHELEFCRAVIEVSGASVAWTTTVSAAASNAAGYAALVARAPVIKRTEALPPGVEDGVVEAPFWLLAAVDDPEEPHLVAFAARPLATTFSPSETARLEALLRLRRALAPNRTGTRAIAR